MKTSDSTNGFDGFIGIGEQLHDGKNVFTFHFRLIGGVANLPSRLKQLKVNSPRWFLHSAVHKEVPFVYKIWTNGPKFLKICTTYLCSMFYSMQSLLKSFNCYIGRSDPSNVVTQATSSSCSVALLLQPYVFSGLNSSCTMRSFIFETNSQKEWNQLDNAVGLLF